MKKSKDKQLWQFWWDRDKGKGEEIVCTAWYKVPSRSNIYKSIRNSSAVRYGYKLMKIDKGEVVEV